MTIYLGPVGNLIALPSVGRGITANLSVPSAVHQIGGRGGKVIDRFPGAASRTYQLSRAWLTQDEISVLEALYMGAYGPGPFRLVEPWRRNMLSANQSSGTDVLADTTGFVASTGTIGSSTVQADHGLRSVAWNVTAAAQQMMTGSIAGGVTADPTLDIPVLPSTSYAAQVRARLGSSTATFRLDISWYTAAGVAISASNGGTVTLLTSAFTTTTGTIGTSPANAALARLSARNVTMGAAQTIYLDKWQFEQASSLGAWVLGTGVPRVSFTDELAQTYNMWPSADASFTLQEVGTS